MISYMNVMNLSIFMIIKKEITLIFLDYFSEEKLINNIYISKYIPIKYKLSKSNLINKILKDIDINTFITLSQ
ncbi:hypothetical protein BN174_3920014 [Clostridioides difficile E15]|nr:hypothetical protein BN174_3920014 [Clostridioides difficile E15]